MRNVTGQTAEEITKATAERLQEEFSLETIWLVVANIEKMMQIVGREKGKRADEYDADERARAFDRVVTNKRFKVLVLAAVVGQPVLNHGLRETAEEIFEALDG
jgi:hypothetical protein